MAELFILPTIALLAEKPEVFIPFYTAAGVPSAHNEVMRLANQYELYEFCRRRMESKEEERLECKANLASGINRRGNKMTEFERRSTKRAMGHVASLRNSYLFYMGAVEKRLAAFHKLPPIEVPVEVFMAAPSKRHRRGRHRHFARILARLKEC